MSILKSLFKRKEVVSISKSDLEEAIFSVYQKIEKDKEQNAIEEAKKDDLTVLIRVFIRIVFFTFFLVFVGISIATLISLFYNNIDGLKSFYLFSTSVRIIVIFVCLGYGGGSFILFRAVKKEKDRYYLISFFSAMTSIAALLVAAFHN